MFRLICTFLLISIQLQTSVHGAQPDDNSHVIAEYDTYGEAKFAFDHLNFDVNGNPIINTENADNNPEFVWYDAMDPQCDRKGCTNTRRTNNPDRELYLCEGCKKKRYCSKHCQKLDWGEYPDRKINKNSRYTGSHRDDTWCPHIQKKTTDDKGYPKKTDTDAYAKIGKMPSRDPQCDRQGCTNTRRTDNPDRELYLCEVCKKKRYCSKHCQKLDWGEYPDRKINKRLPHTGSHRDDTWCPHIQKKTTDDKGYPKKTDTEAYAKIGKMPSRDPQCD
eukprot:813824_1